MFDAAPGDAPSADALSLELERAALEQLELAWERASLEWFKGTLRRPVLEIADLRSQLGRWISEHRTIQIARRLLLEHAWGIVIEVLRHEMAHQYVDEVLGLRAETAHGPAFRRVCEERAIDPRAAGLPQAGAATNEEHRVLERVAKLLALAESPNVHEAQAAMSAAQRMMLKYNLETLVKSPRRAYGFRELGEPSGRIDESRRFLASILGDFFFVEVIWVSVWRVRENKRGKVLEVCGTPENLELSAYVYSFLTHTAERLWRDYKRENGVRGDRSRRIFLAGVMAGFRDKLLSEREQSTEQGLVWAGDADLTAYLRRRHPYIRFTRHQGQRRNETWKHGRAAGRRIVLHRGVPQGPSGGTRLLGGR
jgi:predicted SprT family Zn-dependent metalloprotease